MRLIDADALKNELCKDCIDGYCTRECYEVHLIKAQPTIEAEPVRRGRWMWDDEGYHCSECFFHAYGNTLECMDGTYKHCPNCGSRMEGQE